MVAARNLPHEVRLVLCALLGAIGVYVAVASFGSAHLAPGSPSLGGRGVDRVRLAPQPAVPVAHAFPRRVRTPAATRRHVTRAVTARILGAPARPHTPTQSPGATPVPQEPREPVPTKESPTSTPGDPAPTASSPPVTETVGAAPPPTQEPAALPPLPAPPPLPAVPSVPSLPALPPAPGVQLP
jgi:hypothetical protein